MWAVVVVWVRRAAAAVQRFSDIKSVNETGGGWIVQLVATNGTKKPPTRYVAVAGGYGWASCWFGFAHGGCGGVLAPAGVCPHRRRRSAIAAACSCLQVVHVWHVGWCNMLTALSCPFHAVSLWYLCWCMAGVDAWASLFCAARLAPRSHTIIISKEAMTRMTADGTPVAPEQLAKYIMSYLMTGGFSTTNTEGMIESDIFPVNYFAIRQVRSCCRLRRLCCIVVATGARVRVRVGAVSVGCGGPPSRRGVAPPLAAALLCATGS